MSDVSLKEIATYILSELVDHPDQLTIDEKVGRSSVILGISSPYKEDVSIIIGKNGHTITSFKRLMERIAHRRGSRCTIYVVD